MQLRFAALFQRWRTLAMPALLALSAPLSVPAMTIIGGDVAPYCWSDSGHATGPATDLVREMARRLGHAPETILIYPWARTVVLGATQRDTVIFPLSRTAEREENYTWIVELLQDQYVLLARADSVADISSLPAARALRIGYLRGSPGGQLLAAAGNQHPGEAAGSDELNARKLQLGRIDAWLVNRRLAEQAWLKIGGRLGDLRTGATLLELHMYLAAGKTFPAEEAAKWRAAYQDIKNDGTLQNILRPYNLGEPAPKKRTIPPVALPNHTTQKENRL